MGEVRGSGTVQQIDKTKDLYHCRKWRLRVFLGKSPRDGRNMERSRRFEGSRSEAQAELRRFMDEIESERAAPVTTGTTFEDECARFLEERRNDPKRHYSDNRMRKLESTLKAACRHIGKADLGKVTPAMLEGMCEDMMAGDTVTGKPAGGTYAKSVLGDVGLVYRNAMRKGRAASNPCALAEAPRSDTAERRALPPGKVREVLARLDVREEAGFAFWVALSFGLRRGEICGLSWEDVDLDELVLNVRHSYDVFGNLKDPKTRAGERTLPLNEATAAAFREHRDAQRGRGLAAEGAEPVILSARGRRMSPDVMGKEWAKAREELGLGDVTLHELRHSFASALAASGVDVRTAMELCGHSSPTMTLATYQHSFLERKREAADAMSTLLGQVPPPPSSAA